MVIKPPETDEEFRQYFDLRWRILRAPWGEPRGTEKDESENACLHLIASEKNLVVGCARLQFNSEQEAQIRYMAVAPSCRQQGIGRRLMTTLEQQAKKRACSLMVLDAREGAIGFYRRLGYEMVKKSYLLFGEIQHWRMHKTL